MKEKEIVINNCYGGFSLSPLALKELAKLKKKDCYFFKLDIPTDTFIPLTLQEAENDMLFWAFSVPNPNEILKLPRKIEDRLKYDSEYEKKCDSINIWDRKITRDDKDLIAVVKKLGTEKASGKCSKLKIVKIPADVDWEIEEYDGLEWVSEKHRTWN